MTDLSRDQRLFETFAHLADTLVADYDVVDLLQSLVDTCRELLDAAEAGILLSDTSAGLEVVASTSESSRLVELMQLSAQAGPCIESFRTGRVVAVADIASAPDEWSDFRSSALENGFRSAHAVPLRLRDTTIGSLNVLRTDWGELPSHDALAAQAFADVATIGILHERSIRESTELAEQLQAALDSRAVIEQAKGFVAYSRRVPIDDAFAIIRSYARSHHMQLRRVAEQIVNLTLDIDIDAEY